MPGPPKQFEKKILIAVSEELKKKLEIKAQNLETTVSELTRQYWQELTEDIHLESDPNQLEIEA